MNDLIKDTTVQNFLPKKPKLIRLLIETILFLTTLLPKCNLRFVDFFCTRLSII